MSNRQRGNAPVCPRPSTERAVAEFDFPKAARLLRGRDYQRVFDRAGLKVSTAEILFLACENTLPRARLGLVLSRKNVRRAVQRNRIKRIIRESFRHHQQQLAGLDIIVLGRRGVDTLDNATLHETCAQLWRQLQRRAEKQQRKRSQS